MNAIKYDHLRWHVDSEKLPSKKYLVDLISISCECPNWQCQKREVKDAGYFCKHLKFVRILFANEMLEIIRNQMKGTE